METKPVHIFAELCIAWPLPVPLTASCAPHPHVDYHVRLNTSAPLPAARPEPLHEWRDAHGKLALALHYQDNAACLRVPGLVEARIERDGNVILWRAPSASDASLHHALLDQILPRVLAGDGELMLHAGAVLPTERGALVLLGDSGFGKSTLSAAFARAGATTLTDDCVRLVQDEDRVRAVPTYPGIRLLPDSLAAVYGDQAPASQPMADYSSKRRIAAPSGHHAASSADVAAFIVLQAPDDNPAIELTPLTPADACMALMRNSFALDPTDPAHMQPLLQKAARATQAVPAFALHHPRDYARLPEVVAGLRELV